MVDLSRVLAGPYATMVLSDLGARVVKVERPGRGDDARRFGPFHRNRSVYFESLNRGKSALALDLRDPVDRRRFEEILEGADVLVENFRPGTMEKMGYGWDVLHTRLPKLVYAAVSGFGHTGPYSGRPAYDMVVQAMGGLMSLTGHPGGPPTRVGTSVGDIAAGLFAAIGILSAPPRPGADRAGADGGHRHARLPGRHPRECHRPLLDYRSGSGPSRRPPPVDHPFRHLSGRRPAPGDRPPATTDCSYPSARRSGGPSWRTIPGSPPTRPAPSTPGALGGEIEDVLATDTAAAWLGRLVEAGIPCGPINDIAAVVARPGGEG